MPVGKLRIVMAPLCEMAPLSKAREADGMNKAGLMLAIVSASLAPAGASAVELPAGPNKDVVARACSSCHDLDMVYEATGQTREGWNGTIEEMTGYGLKVSAAERAQILEYLASFLGPDAKKPR
jgi:cytochrome c5